MFPIVNTQEELRECVQNNQPFKMGRRLNDVMVLDGLTNFPKWLQLYTNVRSLSLIGCSLSRLPSFVKYFPLLEHIWLDHNKFTSFPKALTQLPRLEMVNLNDNLLTDVRSLTNTNIIIAFFNNNKLRVLPSFSHSVLDIHVSNNFIEYVPEDVCKYRTLNVLELDHNQIEFLPDCFTDLTTLTTLNLNNNHLNKKSEKMVRDMGFGVPLAQHRHFSLAR